MANGNILSDFGINLLEEEIDDVIFQTNEFLTDATFTGSQGPFWWILQMCMALAALFAIIMAAGMAYKMMVKQEPLDILKLFRPLAVSIILCWWYPPADTGMAGSGSSWCFLDFLSYIPNCIGSYTHDLYEAEASQISDKFEEVQELIHVRDTMYTSLQARADVAHTGTSDPNLIEATMEQTGVDEVTNMEKDASKLWFTSLTAGAVVGIDKIVMLIALIVFRIGWWATIYCQQILLGMLTIFGPIQWAFSLLPKWEGAWAKWLIRYLTVHFYGAMLYFVGFYVLLLFDIVLCIQVENLTVITASEQTMAAYLQNSFFSAGYLMARRYRRQVFHLYAKHDVEQKQDIKSYEVQHSTIKMHGQITGQPLRPRAFPLGQQAESPLYRSENREHSEQDLLAVNRRPLFTKYIQ